MWYIIKDKDKAVYREGKEKISQEAAWKLYAGNYMKDSICVAIVALPSEVFSMENLPCFNTCFFFV